MKTEKYRLVKKKHIKMLIDAASKAISCLLHKNKARKNYTPKTIWKKLLQLEFNSWNVFFLEIVLACSAFYRKQRFLFRAPQHH